MQPNYYAARPPPAGPLRIGSTFGEITRTSSTTYVIVAGLDISKCQAHRGNGKVNPILRICESNAAQRGVVVATSVNLAKPQLDQSRLHSTTWS